MDNHKDGKRRKDKQEDDGDHGENRKEKKSRRARSRSKSPAEDREKSSRRKRRHSKSRSPGIPVKQEKQSNHEKEGQLKKENPVRRAKDTDMLNTRTGGAYIPPARLRMMQAQITDKSSIAYQRLAWEALKKSIHGHINKINVGNIGIIIKELLKENIVRGRGLLCRSVIQAQAASPTFTNVYAALVAAVNSRFPNIGELLLKRLVIQFKRGFKRNDKAICISSVSFVAHLINQRVAHEILALELLTLLVETPTDDSVEVAIAFLKECGQKLTEVSSKGVNAIFEMLRNILHEGQLDKRVQYMIEVMFQVWKDGFKDHPALIEELELVPEEEQFTHLLMLDDATDPQDILNVFKFDEKYEENEQKYKTLSKEILGSDVESGDEEGSGESGSEESEEEDDDEPQKPVTIIDNTETNLVALRRTIYLTINSSLDFEECAHKLMKMQLKPGQEVELCHMFLDCCAEQRTYEKFYGLLAQRFCNINRIYIGPFEEIFKDSYSTAHRLDTNRLRNVSKFFAHLLFTDSISWEVLECVRLNEEDTTSSSRIYIKIMFQELAEYMGLKKLNDRLKDPTLQEAFSGVFPRDNPKNTRFSINFFTSIGLGGLTDELREHLKQMPKNVPPPVTDINIESSSSSSSSEDSSSSSDSSSSDSENENDNKKKKEKSNKNKKTDKTPKTPEDEPKKDTERWGHDGFYDTYGKDARRIEPERHDKDKFVRPKGLRGNEVRDRIDQRNNDDRRNRRYENRREDFIRHNNSNRVDDKRNRDDLKDSRASRKGDDNRDHNKTDEPRKSDSRRQEPNDRRNEDSSDDRRAGRDKNDQRRKDRDRIVDRDADKNRDNNALDSDRDYDRRKEYRDRDDESHNDDRGREDRRTDREKDENSQNDRDVYDSKRRERDRDDEKRNDRGVEDSKRRQRDRDDEKRNDRVVDDSKRRQRDRDDEKRNDHRDKDSDKRKEFRNREDERNSDDRGRDDRRTDREKDDDRQNDRDIDVSKRRERDRDDEKRNDHREKDSDRRKEYRNRENERRDDDDRGREDKRTDREKYSKRQNDPDVYDSKRRERDRDDDERNGHRERDDNRRKENRDKNDERRKDYREREGERQDDKRTDRDRDDNRQKGEYERDESRSEKRDREEKFERYWNANDNIYDKNGKGRDADSGDQKTKNKDTEVRVGKDNKKIDKRSSEDDDDGKSSRRREKERDNEEDEKSRRHEKNGDRNKKSKEDNNTNEDKSGHKNKKKKHKKKHEDDSSDTSEDEKKAGSRYWDVMDIKSKKEAIKEVNTKDRARRARS